MQFDDFEMDDPELKQRLSSWRRMPGVVEKRLDSGGEPGVNETELRIRQRHIGNMCLTTSKQHAAFYAQLEDFIRRDQEERSQHLQQRIEDMAAFCLGVFEQSNALLLERSIQNESNNLPREVIQTVTVSPPPPPKSWFQRLLGI
jgi:hypothetical protein